MVSRSMVSTSASSSSTAPTASRMTSRRAVALPTLPPRSATMRRNAWLLRAARASRSRPRCSRASPLLVDESLEVLGLLDLVGSVPAANVRRNDVVAVGDALLVEIGVDDEGALGAVVRK